MNFSALMGSRSPLDGADSLLSRQGLETHGLLLVSKKRLGHPNVCHVPRVTLGELHQDWGRTKIELRANAVDVERQLQCERRALQVLQCPWELAKGMHPR